MMSDEMSVTVRRRRVKVGATLDPDLIGAVDLYVGVHPGVDRSAVIDDALRLWCTQQQDIAMERQLRAPRSKREDQERAAWQRIQAAAARRTFRLP